MRLQLPRLTPERYRQITLVAAVLLGVIIVTGGAVRLSGSGLGCPQWPTCGRIDEHKAYDGHAFIEFGNRLFTGLVTVAVIMCVLGSIRRVPRRRDLVRLSWGLVAGLFAQGLLGGLLVLTELPPQLVMGHFLVSIALLTNAIVLHRRAREPEGTARLVVQPSVRAAGVVLLAVTAIVVIAGTVVTASGPHGGDERAERLDIDIPEIARVHGSAVVALIVVILATFVLLHRTNAPEAVSQRLGIVVGVVLAQGAIGYIQYFNDIPALLVGFHIAGATAVWSAVLWYFLNLWTREPTPSMPPRERAPALVSS